MKRKSPVWMNVYKDTVNGDQFIPGAVFGAAMFHRSRIASIRVAKGTTLNPQFVLVCRLKVTSK